MTLTNSGSAAPATPAATSTSATVNPSAVTSGSDHRALPPVPSTQLEGDISLDFDNDSPTPTPAPAPEVPKAEAPKPQPKAEESPTEEADPFDVVPKSVKDALSKNKPPEQKPEAEQKPAPEQTPQEPTGRQYTGVAEVDAVLKKLPNATYNAVKDQLPKWYEAYKAQGEAPKYLAAHPEAYTLMPEYRQAQEQVETSGFEAENLRDALIACKSGQPVKLITKYDKHGQPIFETFQPQNGKHDPKLEIALMQYYQTAQSQLREAQQQVMGAKQQFQQRVQQEHQFIEQSFAKVFPGIKEDVLSPEEQAFKTHFEKIIPDSITPAHARKIAHFAMIAQLRLAKQFQAYVEQNSAQTRVAKPAKGASTAAGDVGDIPLDPEAMFGDR